MGTASGLDPRGTREEEAYMRYKRVRGGFAACWTVGVGCWWGGGWNRGGGETMGGEGSGIHGPVGPRKGI